MAAGNLTVEIVGRIEKLEAALAKAESKTKKTGDTLDKELSSPMGKAAIKAGKLFAAMGAVEGATKGITVAASGIQGLFAAMSGDGEKAERAFEAMAETAKQLPFGIGPVVAAFEQMLFTVSGLNEVLAEQEEKLKEIAELDRRIAKTRASNEALASMEARLALAKAQTEEQQIELQFLADKQRIEAANQKLMRDAFTEEGSTRKFLVKNAERRLEIEMELAELSRRQSIQALEERKEAERLAELATIRAEQERKLAEEQRENERKRVEAERERMKLEREAERKKLEAQRELERRQKEMLREAERAAKEAAAREEKRRQQQIAANQATGTASTAFGSFTFGQVRSGTGTERTNNHLAGIEGGIKTLVNLIQTSIRGVGFG